MQEIQITQIDQHNGLNLNHKKVKHFARSFKLLIESDVKGQWLRTLIELRIYETSNSVFTCLWNNDKDNGIYAHGSGKSNKYNYYQAIQKAFETSGILTNRDIHQEQDIVDLLEYYAKMRFIDKFQVIECYG